jgi:hypothetical protein
MILFGTFFGPQGEYQVQTLFGRLLVARRKTCNSPPHETATMWHSELGFTMRQIVALTHIIYGGCHLLWPTVDLAQARMLALTSFQ